MQDNYGEIPWEALGEDSEPASIWCALRVLERYLSHRPYIEHECHILQIRFKRGKINDGPLRRDSLMSHFKFPYGTQDSEIAVPEWPIAEWRCVKIVAITFDENMEEFYRFYATIAVARCDREKLPGFLPLPDAQSAGLDWAPVLAVIGCEGSFAHDTVLRFTHKRSSKNDFFIPKAEDVTIDLTE